MSLTDIPPRPLESDERSNSDDAITSGSLAGAPMLGIFAGAVVIGALSWL
ncbi:MAG: hypothetical protein GKR86_04820, partial [Ilumatobacter sp.]|nr:hypothetical protein [Ilumatobacter sp.]